MSKDLAWKLLQVNLRLTFG